VTDCINAPRCKGMAARAYSAFLGRVIGYRSCEACIRKEAAANGLRPWCETAGQVPIPWGQP